MSNKISGKSVIKVGGKQRPFKFGTNCSMLYCEKRGVTLKEMQSELSDEKLKAQEVTGSEIRDLLWAALVAGHRSSGLDPDDEPTPWQVGDWIDDMTPEDWKKVLSHANPDVESSKKKSKS